MISADRVDLTGITETFRGGLDVRGGSGPDLISYRSDTAFVNKPVKINTSGGNDLVLFRELVYVNVPTTIRLGGGADEARLLQAQGNNRLSVFGDGGNDLINLSAGVFDELVTLNGGGNNDSLVGEANTFAVPPRIIAIENIG